MSRASACRHQWKAVAVAGLLSALITADCCTNSYGSKPNPDHPAANPAILAIGFVFHTGLLQPLLPASILVLACAGLGGPSAVLAKLLSSGVLRWVADISFDVYLLHPLVIMGIWSVLPPSLWFDPGNSLPFIAVTCLVCLLSFATAVLHGNLVLRMTALLGLHQVSPKRKVQ